MRLKHIKLSGFKSFVDPTTVSVPGRLVGVVGPNGCGKSNVIDAVRWVMGESSAKTLRGDSMADVIFNGSAARKPVGKAAVELVFDNSAGQAPGAYAAYGEIAVRRELSRDGQSTYYINKGKCRRRDITDIFLGTGLGARSYSIIEQGMVSRIIEAKPEDLRVLVEEAAGISKYKERRRETETRIRHTRENLDRLDDIRSELETQLRRLKRQSTAAERYKQLKQEERRAKAELTALRWRALDQQLAARDQELATLSNQAESHLAEQRGVEAKIEALRKQQAEDNERLNQVQGQYYRAGAEIASVEQSIEHLKETRQQQQEELRRLAHARDESARHLEQDEQRIGRLQQQLSELAPELQTARQQVDAAARDQAEGEQAFRAWQTSWDEFGDEAAQPEQERQVQRTRIQEHEQQIVQLVSRQGRLEVALREIDDAGLDQDLERAASAARAVEAQCDEQERLLVQLESELDGRREGLQRAGQELDAMRERHHDLSGRLRSLRELQSAALGEYDEALQLWLQEQGLDQAPRLTARLRVTSGWERAVDQVLGARVGAVYVDSLDQVFEQRNDADADLFLVERGGSAPVQDGPMRRLSGLVGCDEVDLSPWLRHVFVATDRAEAMQARARLQAHESVVTADGLWVGPHWMALHGGSDNRAGMLARETEIEELSAALAASQERIDGMVSDLEGERRLISEREAERVRSRRALDQLVRERAECQQRVARHETRIGEMRARREQLQQDLAEVTEHLRAIREAESQARGRLGDAERAASEVAARREVLLRQRDALRDTLAAANRSLAQAGDTQHKLEFEIQGLETELKSLREATARNAAQQEGMIGRQRELEALLEDRGRPEVELHDRLKSLLGTRLEVEQELNEARRQVADRDDAMREQEQQRHGFEQQVMAARDALEQARIARQELVVRRDTLGEQISEADWEPGALLAQMPDTASESEWAERVASIATKIERIGPVNLVAIDEYEEQSERKVYLDKQHADLSEALATLESVIQKIDRETRARFKDTFERLNGRFQDFFPRLFGGGSAYLELTSQDLLETGVSVMARPPGKRNSTIHLLSGGEKALTAVALMFAFFDLNPAPFCMLDEVDAPLDDANVERYSDILRSLSERTQLIFITHNKITMSVADILIGVTMGEPGVSRLVAVDIEEAIEMAAQ